ncbi:hypothetical protein [Stenotrophomonas maltophilia]|uniref:hypothetical protein n=1 Tax=Stenotrophomonas maltophilia TaxID=40324 RepID=UPI0034DB498F
MQAERMDELLWALRLVGNDACHRASLRLAAAIAPLVPSRAQRQVANGAFAVLGRSVLASRHERMVGALLRLGHCPSIVDRLATRALANAWLRQVRARHLLAQPFTQVQAKCRAIRWNDPHALWPAAAGRRRVICVLPSGDLELATAAVLDRPGAPAHYFINSPYSERSVEHRVLLELQRQGHRLDVGTPRDRGLAWRLLRKGVSVVTLFDPRLPDALRRQECAPLRLARLARVPVLLLGHRHTDDGADAGTLHVLGEFSGSALEDGAAQVRRAARAFLAASPEDWRDLER